MNLISLSGQVVFLGPHGGGGRLVQDLTAPVVRAEDAETGDSVRFRLVGEPQEADYAETRLYRYDASSRSFSVLDAVFAPGETEKTVSGLGLMERYSWLPAAFDVEGNYVPGGVVGALVTDGSAGLVERVRLNLVRILREDAVLAGYHPQWGSASAERCHVMDGALQGGATSGRAPFVEVETVSVKAERHVVHAVYRVGVVTAGELERLCEDVRCAVMASGDPMLGSEHVMEVRARTGAIERGYPLKRAEVLVEAEIAVRM